MTDALRRADDRRVRACGGRSVRDAAARQRPVLAPRSGPDWRPALVADHGGGPERFPALPPRPTPRVCCARPIRCPRLWSPPGTRFRSSSPDGDTSSSRPPPRTRAGPSGARPRPETPSPPAEPDQLATLSAELAEARDRATRLQGENETMTSTLEELEIWRGELERRLAETTTELADTRARLAEAHAAAQMEALVARAEADALEQAARELSQAAEQARSRS